MTDCSLCAKPYDSVQHEPRKLPCGHIFCTKCLIRLKIQQRIVCPGDTKTYIGHVHDLPKCKIRNHEHKNRGMILNSPS